MKQLIRNLKIAFAVLLVLSIALGVGLVYQQRQSQTALVAVAGENADSLRQRYAQAGKILSSDGAALAWSADGQRLYAEDEDLQRSVSQFVGDYTHHMTNTIETLYQEELLGSRRDVLEQLLLDFSGRGMQGSNITLTIDSNLNRLAYQLMSSYSGAAVLLNYHTGEILAMVSTPAASMRNIIDYEDLPETSLFNKALMGRYAPGSTFKIFTTAAFLSTPGTDPLFKLDDTTGEPLRPNGARDSGHGVVDLNLAFIRSCNVYFGECAVQVGADNMIATLNKTGLQHITSVDRLWAEAPVWNDKAARHDDALLSWFGTGQPVGQLILTFNPLDLALTSAAVVNGGELLQPHLVKYITNPLNRIKEEAKPKVLQRMFPPEIAARIEQLMLNAISSEDSIQTHARIPGYEVGGKSGTVEVQNAGGRTENALWTGFVKDPRNPYAVAVVVENADGTNSTAVAIGGKLLDAAIKHAGS